MTCNPASRSPTSPSCHGSDFCPPLMHSEAALPFLFSLAINSDSFPLNPVPSSLSIVVPFPRPAESLHHTSRGAGWCLCVCLAGQDIGKERRRTRDKAGGWCPNGTSSAPEGSIDLKTLISASRVRPRARRPEPRISRRPRAPVTDKRGIKEKTRTKIRAFSKDGVRKQGLTCCAEEQNKR